jgi:hypothetical protein
MPPIQSAKAAAARFRFRVRAAFAFFLAALLYVFYHAPAPTTRRAGAPAAASGTPGGAVRAASAISAVAARAAAAAMAPRAAPARLLSAGRPVTSDVRGNLADASVITGLDPPGDWLTDRWQAAADMSGTPLPGEHWVEIDLGAVFELSRFILIWEKAYAVKYAVRGRLFSDGAWADFAIGRDAASPHSDETHIVHVLDATKTQCGAASCVVRARFVRLVIAEPATVWGASLWRWEVWGRDAAAQS